MDFKLVLIVLISILILGVHLSFSIPEPAPGPSTMTQYCANGTCNTIGNNIVLNTTRGEYPVGQYPNGTEINQVVPISIVLSNTCIKLEELNQTSHCLTYKDLWLFDQTNHLYSGNLVLKPYPHRGSEIHNGITIINNGNSSIVVDPDYQMLTRSRIITVEENNFTWINPDQNGTNTQLIEHINRFITSPCESATVAPNLSLVKDTILYLQNGCTSTRFNDTVIIHRTETPFSWDNPFSSLHYFDYLKNIFHVGFASQNETGGNGPANCINHKCSYKDPYSNPNW